MRHSCNAEETCPRACLGCHYPVVRADNVSLQAPADGKGEIASGDDTRDVNKIPLVQDILAKIERKNFRSLCNDKGIELGLNFLLNIFKRTFMDSLFCSTFLTISPKLVYLPLTFNSAVFEAYPALLIALHV